MREIFILVITLLLLNENLFAQGLKADFISKETKCYVWKFDCSGNSTAICNELKDEFSEELAKHCVFIDKANFDETLKHYKMNDNLDSVQVVNFLREQLKTDFAIMLELKEPSIARQEYKFIVTFISLKNANKIPRSHTLDANKILQSDYRRAVIKDLFIHQLITKFDCNESSIIAKIRSSKAQFQVPKTNFDNFDEHNSFVFESIFFLLSELRNCPEQKDNYALIDEISTSICEILEGYLSLCIRQLFEKSNLIVGKEKRNQEHLLLLNEIVEKQERLMKIYKVFKDKPEFVSKIKDLGIDIRNNKQKIKTLQK
jgi:hypothetical protein